MPYDGLYDSDTQDVADETGSTYGEAQDAKDDGDEPGPSDQAKQESDD